ncbi:hypothetical protein [Neisseria sp. Ec49-e6-T10]|uniref:hypothetical protein n=1 Tax=Neisseria sp. Ec49-e6-T10 TaxID=3140744 RepID=UPI003EBD02EA
MSSRYYSVLNWSTKIGVSLFIIAYPFIVYFGLNYWSISFLAPCLLCLFVLRLVLSKQHPQKTKQFIFAVKAISIIGILLILASWLLKQNQWLLFYPVAVNLIMLGLFAYSLLQPPSIIERLARITEPELPQSGIRYTRTVTQIWCVFFVINASIALWTCYLNNMDIWTLYNGAISYILMGTLLGSEWLFRQWVRHK